MWVSNQLYIHEVSFPPSIESDESKRFRGSGRGLSRDLQLYKQSSLPLRKGQLPLLPTRRVCKPEQSHGRPEYSQSFAFMNSFFRSKEGRKFRKPRVRLASSLFADKARTITEAQKGQGLT
jgi:hypothetical protein